MNKNVLLSFMILCYLLPILFVYYNYNSNNSVSKIDVTLRSIRSLNKSHIQLLEHMKYITLDIIKNNYGIDECYIKMFFHYEPSTYHLHIHFVNIANYDSLSSVEYSHELNSVIFNILICSDYYQLSIIHP